MTFFLCSGDNIFHITTYCKYSSLYNINLLLSLKDYGLSFMWLACSKVRMLPSLLCQSKNEPKSNTINTPWGPRGAFCIGELGQPQMCFHVFEVPRHKGDDNKNKIKMEGPRGLPFFLCFKNKTEILSFYRYIFNLFVVDLCLAFPPRPIIFSRFLLALLSPFSSRLHYMQ